jgi:kynureninase
VANILNKEAFFLPEGVIYLDGNSLGPLPRAVPARVQAMMTDEWGEMLIRGWNKANWMEQPSRVGDMSFRRCHPALSCARTVA